MTRPVLRPFWCVGLTFLVVLLLCPWCPVEWLTPLLIVSGAAVIVSFALPALRRLHAVPLIAICCLLSIGSFYLTYRQQVVPVEASYGKPVTLQVRVVECGEAAVLQVESGDLPTGTRLYYRPDPETVLQRHDRFESVFVLRAYSSDTPLSALMRRASGVWSLVETVNTVKMDKTLTAGTAPWTDVLYRTKGRLTKAVGTRLQGDAGAVTNGICFGVDEQLSGQATTNFRACGVSHLFAVSGLHLTVLLFGLLAVLKRVRVPRRVRAVIGAVLTLLFMALIGFTPSVVRSGVLCTVVMLGQCLRRRADSRNSLGLALFLLLVTDPFAVYDAGLLLSFSATIGLLFWTKPLTAFLLGKREPVRLAKLRKWLAATVAVSLAATAATLPVTVLYFGRISLVSVPANLLTTLPAEGVLITGWLGAIASTLGLSVLAEPLLLVSGLMSRYLLWIGEKISAFSLSTVAIEADFLVLWIVGTYAILLVGYRVLSQDSRRVLAGVCAVALGVALLGYRGATYDLLRVSLTQNSDLAVVMTYRGSTVLVVAPSSRASLYDAASALREQGVSRVDALFLIGGKEPAISYITTELKPYLPSDAAVFYDGLPVGTPLKGSSLAGRRVWFGRSLSAEMQDGQPLLCWDGQRLWFAPWQVKQPPTDGAALFCAGQPVAWLRTDDGMQALGDTVDTVVLTNGDWHIKGVGNNGVLGTGSQTASEN